MSRISIGAATMLLTLVCLATSVESVYANQGGRLLNSCGANCTMYGSHAAIRSGVLAPGSGGVAIGFVRSQSSSTTAHPGVFQAGYYRADHWTAGDCDRPTVLTYTASFIEWKNSGTSVGSCNVSTTAPPNDSLFSVIRTKDTSGYFWSAFLNDNRIFSIHELNWGSGPAFAGGEFASATGQVNVCFGCDPGPLWGYPTAISGVGWTDIHGGGTFNDGGLWQIGNAGAAFRAVHQ